MLSAHGRDSQVNTDPVASMPVISFGNFFFRRFNARQDPQLCKSSSFLNAFQKAREFYWTNRKVLDEIHRRNAEISKRQQEARRIAQKVLKASTGKPNESLKDDAGKGG